MLLRHLQVSEPGPREKRSDLQGGPRFGSEPELRQLERAAEAADLSTPRSTEARKQRSEAEERDEMDLKKQETER